MEEDMTFRISFTQLHKSIKTSRKKMSQGLIQPGIINTTTPSLYDKIKYYFKTNLDSKFGPCSIIYFIVLLIIIYSFIEILRRCYDNYRKNVYLSILINTYIFRKWLFTFWRFFTIPPGIYATKMTARAILYLS